MAALVEGGVEVAGDVADVAGVVGRVVELVGAVPGAGGARPGVAPAPNARPTAVPGAGLIPAAPAEAYVHAPLALAVQIAQYAVADGVWRQASSAGAGKPLTRHTKLVAKRWVPSTVNPAAWRAAQAETGSPAAQPV